MDMLEYMPQLVAEGLAAACLIVSGIGALVAVAKAIFHIIGKE